MQAYFPILLLLTLSGWVLWKRYHEGQLLTPASGLHAQILIFFGVGGLAFVSSADADPTLTPQEVLDYTTMCCWPLALGYVIAIGVERRWFRRPSTKELVLTRAGILSPGIVILLALFGFGGYLLEGMIGITGFSAIPGYFKILFFPSLFLSLISALHHRTLGKPVELIILSGGTLLALFTPWRSVLVLVACTLLLAIAITKPKWVMPVILTGMLMMIFLIPFQLQKKADYDEFQQNPMATLKKSLAVTMPDRLTQIESFTVIRLDYVRELTYVERALKSGMTLLYGQTYENIFYQLIPRMFWHDKPEMAHWAGFDLPRQIGLLHQEDENTSWGVNMFAEDTYNFGLWSLLGFVPLVFILAHGLEKLSYTLYKTPQAVLIANVAFFYFFLDIVSVIFAVSSVVALLLVVKLVDWSLQFSETRQPLAGKNQRIDRSKKRASAKSIPRAGEFKTIK